MKTRFLRMMVAVILFGDAIVVLLPHGGILLMKQMVAIVQNAMVVAVNGATRVASTGLLI
jgi:hypothetical protein